MPQSEIRTSGRTLKKEILNLLCSDKFEQNIGLILKYPHQRTVNALFSFFYPANEEQYRQGIPMRSVTVLGRVMDQMAMKNMESARVVMRRLMWNLNDESGGIGWGSPEAMGEIMAVNKHLAEEYHHILISYIWPGGNFLEHEGLQAGLLWGLGRFAHARPEFVQDIAGLLMPFMKSNRADLRGLAVWAAGAVNDPAINPLLKSLINDKISIRIFIKNQFEQFTIGRLAIQSLSRPEKEIKS